MGTLAQIAGEVAREWAASGRIAVPPARDAPEDDTAFWEEVARRAAGLEEAFNPHQPRFPKGHPKAGQWRPKLTPGAGRVAPGHLARDIDALKSLVADQQDFYSGRNIPTSHLEDIGLEVEKVALRYSARRHYEKRLAEIRTERAAIQARKWDAYEAKWNAEPDMEKRWAMEPEQFIGAKDAKLLRSFQDEEVRLIRERDRADRDAMLGVLKELRPMGGKLNESTDEPEVDVASGIERQYVEDHPGEYGPRKMKAELDESLK